MAQKFVNACADRMASWGIIPMRMLLVCSVWQSATILSNRVQRLVDSRLLGDSGRDRGDLYSKVVAGAGDFVHDLGRHRDLRDFDGAEPDVGDALQGGVGA